MEIQQETYKRNKILNKYSKRKNKNSSESIHLLKEYKTIRNKITSMKRNSKVEYYNKYFDNNKNKLNKIWKGIRSIVNINTKSRKGIQIITNNGKKLTDPSKIAQIFIEYFSNVGKEIDKKNP